MAAAATIPPPLPDSMSMQIELVVAARDLPSLDVMSASDPYALLYMLDAAGRWAPLGRTEVQRDSSNPVFSTTFTLPYHFEEVQRLRVEVWDYDSPSHSDPLGCVCTCVGAIMGAHGATLVLPLDRMEKDGKVSATKPGDGKRGRVILKGAEASGSSDVLRVCVRTHALTRKDWFGSSDPFVRLSRVLSMPAPGVPGSSAATPAPQRLLVWESEVRKNRLDASFDEAAIPLARLCNGDVDAPLALECWDWNSSGSHSLIGEAVVSTRALLDAAVRCTHTPLINPAKLGKRGYTASGQLAVPRAVIEHRPTFLEYIRGGCEIRLVVGVDFTGSNGDPRLPTSLHYWGGTTPNEYLQAITSVGDIVLPYDSDQQVPFYGFGASIHGAPVNHCFAITLDEARPEVVGVPGMVAAYQRAFSSVTLHGPTYLAPIIQRTAEMASGALSHGKQSYTILLLITDGQMNDTDATIRAVVDASALPMSIVIVGVGGADFAGMHVLDADDAPLTSGTRSAMRDIVQFVPFRKYAASGSGAGSLLAKEVLAEVPQQLVQYFTARGIAPLPPTAPAFPSTMTIPTATMPAPSQPAPSAPPVTVVPLPPE